MKHIYFLIFIILLHIPSLFAQADSEYNAKGDQALKKQDYDDARMWFSEGIEKCDQYSIRRLTELWNTQPAMQSSMHFLMSKCANCLEYQAKAGDTNAKYLLSDFYTKGIGVEKDSAKAAYWVNILFGIPLQDLTSSSATDTKDTIVIKQKTSLLSRIDYFIGYSFSPTMPIGITIGGHNRWGGYVSFKTNMNPQSYRFECNNEYVLNSGLNSYYNFDKKKWNNIMFTGGILCPIMENIHLTIGAGYGKRDLFWHIAEYDYKTTQVIGSDWCYNTQSSYKGFTLELGGTFQYKHLIILGGCNSISFKDLDVYLGIGYTF